ncbi:MAG: hypothetical protein ACYS6I_06275 [Planctomycetota bacterium]
MDAEVLIDALCWISGTRESYSSPIPEPFTFIPEEHRRPARDTGLESERNNKPTNAQRLHLLNSTHIQNKIEHSRRLRRLIRTAKGNSRKLIKMIYLNILSRYPTQAELTAAEKYFQTKDINKRQATNDLVWVLINTKEFLYRH